MLKGDLFEGDFAKGLGMQLNEKLEYKMDARDKEQFMVALGMDLCVSKFVLAGKFRK